MGNWSAHAKHNLPFNGNNTTQVESKVHSKGALTSTCILMMDKV